MFKNSHFKIKYLLIKRTRIAETVKHILYNKPQQKKNKNRSQV